MSSISSSIACCIATVNCSCIAPRLPKCSTTRLILLNPTTFPFSAGILKIWVKIILAIGTFAAEAFTTDTTNAISNTVSTVSTTANAAYNTANTGYIQANAAYATANASFACSNNKVSKAGDTMTGTLVINVASNLDALTVSNNNITTIALRPDGHLELYGEANVRERLSVGSGSYTILPNLISQFTGNSALYSQVNQQNLNANGTGDFVITTNNGSDTVNYADMGMAGNTYNNTTFNAFPFVNPNDGYFLIVGNDSQNFGGNVFYGTTGSGGSARTTQDTCGLGSQTEFGFADPASAFSRTSKDTSALGSEKSLESWKRSVTSAPLRKAV